jgi:hypothetical protein
LVTWASLDFQPYFTATASNIGYGWWSHDIGGHMFGGKDDELATRWVQLGVFSPILRLHSSLSPFNTKEPWRFGPEARAVMTEFLRLRHRLVPYLHTMNHRAAAGEPLVQPMYWSHPTERDSYQVPNQFMFGTELLIAPITVPRDQGVQVGSVRAWLPDGDWVDLLNGLRYTGGRSVVMHRELSSIPVLAGAGAIVPLTAELIPGNATDNPAALEVLVVIGADRSFEMIEDDGTGSGLDEETVARTPISFDQASGSMTVGPTTGATACLPELRSWRITFVGTDPAVADRISVLIDDARGTGTTTTETGRVSVTVDDITPTRTLRVSVGPEPAPLPNDVAGRIFTLLDRAQIEFETKKDIYALATSDRPLSVRMSHLQALGLDRPLESAVSEILLAAAEPPPQ